MQYILSKRFEKEFAKLSKQTKVKAIKALGKFVNNPDDLSLRVHGLKGKWQGHFSINVTGDTRAVYYVVEENLVRFVAVGTHSQLYG